VSGPREDSGTGGTGGAGDERLRRVSMADGELRQPVDLPVFLDGIGELMQLPPKGSERPKAPAQRVSRPTWRPGAPGRQRALLLALGAVVATVVLVQVLRPKPVTTLPAALAGEWYTDAPRYAGRRLDITTTSLAFQDGEGAAAAPRHPIVRVRRAADAEGTLFRVEYQQGGDRAELDFVWRDVPRPEIRFANQPDLVWTRGAPADSIPATAPRAR
jgi:hypothetical protein